MELELILKAVEPLLAAYAGKLGIMVQVISIIGSLRLAIKPIMSLYSIYIQATPDKSDDLNAEKIQQNKIYKAVVYGLDWIASVKIKK